MTAAAPGSSTTSRDGRDFAQMENLFRDSEAFVGVKVGTSEDDVEPLKRALGDNGLVIWGIGDRSTRAAPTWLQGTHVRHRHRLRRCLRCH